MQWAIAGVLDPNPLFDACLHDQRFDRQCESNRGEWLWWIATTAGLLQHLRDPAISALRVVTDSGDADQLCDLAFHFAHDGVLYRSNSIKGGCG